MAGETPSADYLDALFASLRAFSEELASAKRWLARAEQLEASGWRLTFLAEARAALGRAPERLAAVRDRLAALGPMDALPPPLDRIRDNLTTMNADLSRERDRLAALEAGTATVGKA